MLSPQDLLEVRKVIIAAQLLTSGAFQKELDALQAASDALDAKHGALTKLEEVQRLEAASLARVAKATTEVEKFQADAAAVMTKAQDLQNQIAESTKQLKIDQDELDSAKVQLREDRKAFELGKKETLERQGALMKELERNRSKLADSQARVFAEQKLLDERLTKLKSI